MPNASRRCLRLTIPPALRTAASGGAAQIVAAFRAATALDADQPPQDERAGDEQPKDDPVEERVDEEAGPDGAEGKLRPEEVAVWATS